ncbi:hypothetical protein T459_30961 [Capsicum annuum]|uniref:Ubiquitin-like protease family profile domain-containing protein n=1 Tax=Capsicum annuum TaxID=4072 RepID=A0A2G2Y9U0_CAPAN|nr:hypothetical protein T459_30961 [Capsicum annuum]
MRVVGGRLTKVIYANLIMILEDEYLCREYGWGELSFDETISSLKSSLKPTKTTVGSSYQLVGFPYAFMKLQSTCSKKFKKILDENKSLKSELSKIKTLLLGKLKADGAILSAKQPDNLQATNTACVVGIKWKPGPCSFTSGCPEKKQLAKKGKNAEGHSYEKEEAVEERVTSLGPLNMEEIKQAKNQEPLYTVIYLQTKLLFNKPSEDEARLPNKVIWASNISPTTDDFLSLRKNDNFSTSQQLIYVVQWDFGGTEADKDNIDETKNCGDVDSIINNVIFSVFAASSSLPTSPNVKNTQAERSELGGIKNDTTDVISEVDATTKIGYSKISKELWKRLNVDLGKVSLNHENKIDALYHDFVENGKDFSAIPEKHEVEEYIRGFYCDANVPWNKVNFYLEKGIDKSNNDTLSIKIVDKLPQQTQCDCGTFICTFAEYVIHGRYIPKEISIGYVRMRYGALLWDYGKKKLEADSVLQGYLDVCLLPSRTFVSGGFVIRSFMLSGTIHNAVLPTGRIYPWYIDSSEYDFNPECNHYSQEDQHIESKPFQEENVNLEKIMHTLFKNIDERIAYNHKATMDLTMKINELLSIVNSNNDGELSNETTSWKSME